MKEFYVEKPADIEVYTHGGNTDIILRKSVTQEADEEGNMRWTCEERQMRQPGTISADSVKADFSIFWAVAGDLPGKLRKDPGHAHCRFQLGGHGPECPGQSHPFKQPTLYRKLRHPGL